MSAHYVRIGAGLALAIALAGCNPYAPCYRDGCPYPPSGANSGYVPAYAVVPAPPPSPTHFDTPFNDYTQRSLTVSPETGNAAASNLALQTATPWPRYSGNTNIPGNGAQMVKAVNDFESGTREAETAKRSLQGASGGSGGSSQSTSISINSNNGQ